MTYTDSLRLFLQGDKEKAKRYVREARRLAFLLLRQTRDTGVSSARRRWQAEDGTQIEVIIAGMQVTAVINAPPEPKKQARKFDDFVVHARTTALPDGIDATYPQQILRPEWRTFFYSQTTAGYDDFTGDKGTYRLNPDGTELFPDGIVHAGQVDWRGPDGERISWYGPTTRYWFDVWRQPSAQYGKFVFHLGQVLLDIDQYCTDNDENWAERLVLGAAIREHEDGRWLYLIVADIPDQVTPPVPLASGEIYFSQSYPLGDIYHSLRRVRLTEDPDLEEAMKWSVTGPSEQLLYFSSARACSPWVFNQECSKATTFALDSNPIAVFSDVMSEVVFSPPPTESTRIDLFIAEDASVTYSVSAPSMPPGVGEADIAVDYDEEGAEIPVRIGRQPIGASPLGVYLRMGAAIVPLRHKQAPPSGYTDSTVQCLLMACDARAGMAITERREWSWHSVNNPSNILRVVGMEFYVGGVPDTVVLDTTVGTATALARFDRDVGQLVALADEAVAPHYWLWSLSAIGNTFSIRAALTGFAAACQRAPAHSSDVFGTFGSRGSGTPAKNTTPVADYTGDFFSNNRVDAHGNRAPSGAAVTDGILVASVPDVRPYYTIGGYTRNASYHYVSGSSLPTLTGVQGAQERYHPVWLLGQPIGGET